MGLRRRSRHDGAPHRVNGRGHGPDTGGLNMAKSTNGDAPKAPRRVNVEPGVYKRQGADGKDQLEICWRDSKKRLRWKRIQGGVIAARAELARQKADASRGVRVAEDPRMTFAQASAAWFADLEASEARPKTIKTHRSALKHLDDFFGPQRLAEITVTDVKKYLAKMRNADRGLRTLSSGDKIKRGGYKSWTLRGHAATASAIFTFAGRELGFTGVNPWTLLTKAERPKISSGDGAARDHRVLTDDEARALVSAADGSDRLLWSVGIATGIRAGELLGLVWGDLDLDRKTVRVTAQLVRGDDGKLTRGDLKTRSAHRTIPIPAVAAQLAAAKGAADDASDHAYVFTTRNGMPYAHEDVEDRFAADVIAAGLGPIVKDGKLVKRQPSPHDLRHTFASKLIRDGVPVTTVAKLLGHSSAKTTLSVYSHEIASAEAERHLVTQLDGLFDFSAEPTEAAA